MGFRTQQVDTVEEKQIVIGMIVSTEFLHKIYDKINILYFKSGYLRKLVKWVMEYYDKYKECPFYHIEDIFHNKSKQLRDNESELIAQLLVDLSATFESDEAGTNAEFLYHRALDYFNKQEIEISIENARDSLAKGNVDEAGIALLKYKKVSTDLVGGADILSETIVSKAVELIRMHSVEDEDKDGFLFRYPGDLGKYMGSFFRGQLISFVGSAKKGKTRMLLETAFQAVMARLNVAYFSLEMTESNVKKLFYQRIEGRSLETDRITVPCFDCAFNQTNDCNKPQRVKSRRLEVSTRGLNSVDFNPDEFDGYLPCTACKGVDRSYKVATWFDNFENKKSTEKSMVDSVLRFSTYTGALFVKCYRFSANMNNIRSDLEREELTTGFIPDVIIIDYADILAPESKRTEQRTEVNETWKALGGMASSMDCVVITATQGTRLSFDRFSLEPKDISEDIRKLAHVDAFFALNQIQVEKELGILRIGTLVHRHKDFGPSKECMVLQNMGLSQHCLDSHVIHMDEYIKTFMGGKKNRKKDGGE
jgi:replicative DNA helicase